ncbi:hypothetical protein Tco_0256756 [Tanacetum coccineum]
MLMEKFETPPDSLPITVIYPDDQPMWSSTRTIAPTPSSAIIQRLISDNFCIKGTHMQMIRDNQFDGRIRSDPHQHVADFLEISNLLQYGENQEEAVMLRTFPFSLSGEAKTWLNKPNEGTITSFHQLDNETLVEAWLRMKGMLRTCYGHALTKGMIIQIFYHGLDNPTQEILDARGIFLYNTPNEAFKILKDKVLLKLDFSKDSQNPKPKTIVSTGGSNTNFDHAILMEKFEALAKKIDSEFLFIRKELKEMRDGRRDNQASQIYMKDDTPMCEPHEAIRMTKVIKGEFEKLEDLMVKDVLFTCDTSLEVFNIEFNRMSRIDDDLFAYEVEVANILCDSNKDDDLEQRVSHEGDDDMGNYPSDDIEGFKTYEEYKDDWIYEWNKDIPWVDEKLWTNAGVWTEPTPSDGYCTGGNLLGAYIVGNSLHYQDYEWYEALKDSELKEQALRNKAIMEGLISDDESCNDELCETHELPVCNIRRFEMIKYSFGQDEDYVAVKEYEYDDLARTSDDACRVYQEIFRMMDEG